jgi:hypothetical protein
VVARASSASSVGKTERCHPAPVNSGRDSASIFPSLNVLAIPGPKCTHNKRARLCPCGCAGCHHVYSIARWRVIPRFLGREKCAYNFSTLDDDGRRGAMHCLPTFPSSFRIKLCIYLIIAHANTPTLPRQKQLVETMQLCYDRSGRKLSLAHKRREVTNKSKVGVEAHDGESDLDRAYGRRDGRAKRRTRSMP